MKRHYSYTDHNNIKIGPEQPALHAECRHPDTHSPRAARRIISCSCLLMLCPASMSGSATEIHSFWQHLQPCESSAIRFWTTASLVVVVWWLFKRKLEMLAQMARFHGGPWMGLLSPGVQPDWAKGHCMEFTAETKPNSASLGEFPMDEHFFFKIHWT